MAKKQPSKKGSKSKPKETTDSEKDQQERTPPSDHREISITIKDNSNKIKTISHAALGTELMAIRNDAENMAIFGEIREYLVTLHKPKSKAIKTTTHRRYESQRKTWFRDEREDNHQARKNKAAELEDFLNYQNTARRAIREAQLEMDRGAELKIDKENPGITQYNLGGGPPRSEWLRQLLDGFDAREVGNLKKEYIGKGPMPKEPGTISTKMKDGSTTVKPNAPLPKLHRQGKDRVPWEDLDMWVPPVRRRFGGLGRFEHGRNRHYQTPIQLDFESLEARRLEVERGTVHEARRKELIELDQRNPTQTEHNRTFTKTGLYVSAAEGPDDYQVSYDGSSFVKEGFCWSDCRSVQERLGPIQQEDVSNPDYHPEFFNELADVQAPGNSGKYPKIRTEWAEETYGRREFHAYNGLEPSSPVDSPPHSPIDRPGTGEVAPRGDEDDDVQDRYSKIVDHYGIRDERWPKFADHNNREILLGRLVPYAPVDTDTIPLDIDGANKTPTLRVEDQLDTQCRLSGSIEGVSMRLLRDSLNINSPTNAQIVSTNKTGDMPMVSHAEQPPRRKHRFYISSDDEESNSDDEGDQFRLSYLECSGGVCNDLAAQDNSSPKPKDQNLIALGDKTSALECQATASQNAIDQGSAHTTSTGSVIQGASTDAMGPPTIKSRPQTAEGNGKRTSPPNKEGQRRSKRLRGERPSKLDLS